MTELKRLGVAGNHGRGRAEAVAPAGSSHDAAPGSELR